ncbi:MAG: hypothetical protein Q4F79_12990 [Eubacteriales bacterium]|nr:hypothetical protein [Eubacteriales bacterium]
MNHRCFPSYADRMQDMNPSAIREILKRISSSDTISFGGGLPVPELFPTEQLAAVVKSNWIIAKQASDLTYNPTDVSALLEKGIAAAIREYRGIVN